MSDTLVPENWRHNPVVHAGILGVFAMLAAAVLAAGDMATRDAIAQRKAEDLQASLRQVIPANLHDNDLLKDKLTLAGPDGEPAAVYRARRRGQVIGAAFEVTGYGYGGAIDIIMGVDDQGEVLGVRVLSHAETPGLGDKIERSKSAWIDDFAGKMLGNPPADRWAVKKDGGVFDQFSGATITPRAVVKAVKGGLQWFRDNRGKILSGAAKTPEEA